MHGQTWKMKAFQVNWLNVQNNKTNDRINTSKNDRFNQRSSRQRKQVNDRHKRINRTFLPNGTKVYIKNEGILTKLKPRRIGPYFIFDHDEKGNYFLKDVSGLGTHNKYPLEKLRIVSSSDTQSS